MLLLSSAGFFRSVLFMVNVNNYKQRFKTIFKMVCLKPFDTNVATSAF